MGPFLDLKNRVKFLLIDKGFLVACLFVYQNSLFIFKMHLFNIRSWNGDGGDDMVCVSEVRLSISIVSKVKPKILAAAILVGPT